MLGHAHWPITKLQSNPILTDELKGIQDTFEKYYKLRCGAKKLDFETNMATCIINACFDGKNIKQLEVSGLQTIVLLRFNNHTEIT